jgi:hypothetical protein
MDWNLPLVISAGVFVAFLLWKLRPSFEGARDGSAREAIRAAKKRVEMAKTDDERALALCDAADASVAAFGGAGSAVGYYLRAMRVNPRSAELVDRASKGLARRPRALESLLWRRLGAERWAGGGEAASRAALRQLGVLYAGPLRNPSRARAMEFALEALPKTGQSMFPPKDQ